MVSSISVSTRAFIVALAVSAVTFLTQTNSVHGLQPMTRKSLAMKNAKMQQHFLRPSTTLWVFNERDFPEGNNDKDNDSLESSPEWSVKSKKELQRAALWKQVKEVNNRFWDYTCVFFYVGISCLIFLNICGFGYTITKEEGLNVVPMQTYRQERRWRDEIHRQEKQQQAQQAQTSAVHSPASAISQAPAAFLLQQQQK